MDYQSSLVFLDSLNNFERRLGQLDREDFSLEAFRRFLAFIGDPQDRLKCVHIAGSKGKGSAALLTAQILKEAGYRVGLYTSPHLYDVRERIRILSADSGHDPREVFSGCISEEAFARITGVLKKALEAPGCAELTYFEFLTALMFVHFQQEAVDVVVLETGLGGRLDSTNVVQPLACGITLIDLEHTRILGSSLAGIAREKAGIIKPGCRRVVVGLQPSEAMEVIRQRCAECGVGLFCAGKEIRMEKMTCRQDQLSFDVWSGRTCYACGSRLLGKFQAVNTAVAIGLTQGMEQDGFHVSRDAVERAVFSAVWPARLEIVASDPLIVVDSAHTVESSRCAAEAVRDHFSGRRVVLILGMSGDKDQMSIARNLAAVSRAVVLTQSSHCRAEKDFSLELEKIFLDHGAQVARTASVDEAVEKALKFCGDDDLIFAAGSLFLAAEVRQMIVRSSGLRGNVKQIGGKEVL